MYPLPSLVDIEKLTAIYWVKHYPIHHENNENIQVISRVNYLKKYIGLTNQEKILDIGAGNGNFLDTLKQEFSNNSNCYAVELDNSMREILISKGYKKVVKNIDDVDEYDFSLVIMSYVLEHLPNPKAFLGKILKYMRKDAKLFIEVPNRDDLYKSRLGVHLFVFNVKVFKKLLKDIGFYIVNITTVGPPISDLIQIKTPSSIAKKKIKNFLIRKINKIKIFEHTDLARLIKLKLYKNKIISKEKKRSFIRSSHFEEYGKTRRWIRLLVKK